MRISNTVINVNCKLMFLLISVEVVAICPLLGSEAVLTSFIMMFSNAMIAILVKSSSTFSPASDEKWP